MKKIVLWGLGILVVLGVVGAVMINRLSDLRTPELKKGVTKQAEEKGRTLLKASIEALGGWKRWQAYREKIVRVEIKDTWKPSFMVSLVLPKHVNKKQMQLFFRPKERNSRLRFLEGPRKGTEWGIKQGATYTVDKQGNIKWKKDNSIRFYLPTYQYFMLMPFYLLEAQLIAYAGERTLHGKTYDLVFATWKTYKPHRKMDQYLLWIERKTKHVHFVQYTVRDMLASITGTGKASKYKKTGGLLLAHRWKVMSKPQSEKDWMHIMEYRSFSLAPKLPHTYLQPGPQKNPTSKKSK